MLKNQLIDCLLPNSTNCCQEATYPSKRIEFIDLAKGICILMVVVWHIVPDFFDKILFLSCLRMPLYFCLSGLFYKSYGNFQNFVVKKTDKILIPFLAWYIISYSLHYLKQITIGTEDPHYINEIFYTHDTINAPLWFLLCLFWCNLYFTIIDRTFRSMLSKSIVVVAIAGVGIIMAKLEVFNFLFFGSAMTCLPFFFFGYLLKKTTILYDKFYWKKDLKFLIGGVIIVCLLLNIPGWDASMSYHENYIYGNPLSLYFLGMGWILIALLICKLIGKLPYISFIGRYSIIVLVTHMLLSGVLNPFIEKFLPGLTSIESSIVLLITVILLLPIVIMACRKFTPYITAQSDPIQSMILGH